MRYAVVLLALVGGCFSSDVSRALGARCGTSRDCDDRCLEPETTYPGGMCTVTCTNDGDCPSGGHCVTDQGGVCLFACASDPDCTFLGSGWICYPKSEQDGTGLESVCSGD